ncbi:hypothetical protein NDU88_005517 [Pleurodeles waltl]|uniref:Uncharacterized protein n=1 Tax=Pleurodeles waltl TaxID=8319 RepID=A0AAV7LMW6_PLEWA|nr:hypothetical protein NDU88_005517 [Pleurodeles waltl]
MVTPICSAHIGMGDSRGRSVFLRVDQEGWKSQASPEAWLEFSLGASRAAGAVLCLSLALSCSSLSRDGSSDPLWGAAGHLLCGILRLLRLTFLDFRPLLRGCPWFYARKGAKLLSLPFGYWKS